ncbi:MAG: hypothetical protein MJZ23_09350 [Paludibacteraceae bacterium]|nr:hypothetical protein [Paludibacteraceae bacterium]
MNTNEESEDIVKMREEIVKQCLAGKPLFGKDGALAPMIQSILNAVLEGEMIPGGVAPQQSPVALRLATQI